MSPFCFGSNICQILGGMCEPLLGVGCAAFTAEVLVAAVADSEACVVVAVCAGVCIKTCAEDCPVFDGTEERITVCVAFVKLGACVFPLKPSLSGDGRCPCGCGPGLNPSTAMPAPPWIQIVVTTNRITPAMT